MKPSVTEKECVVLSASYDHDQNELCPRDTDGITGYALSWLHLTNNARENKNVFLRVLNNSGNGIEVAVMPKYVEEVKEYLSSIAFPVYYEESRKLVVIDFVFESKDGIAFDKAVFAFEDGYEDL